LKMKIKKATKRDITGLIQLEAEALREFKDWNITKREEFLDLIKKRLMYIAKENKKIVGYINVKIIERKIILDNVYVKKELRKKGTEKELIDDILTDLKEINFKDVIISCPAILRRFYERFRLKKEK